MIWSHYNIVLAKRTLNFLPQLRRLSVTSFRSESESRTRINEIDFSKLGLDRIRNFSIIAHVDHGKSTLADRMLEYVGAIKSSPTNKQVLDKLRVERERGITVKAQTASIIYKDEGTNVEYLLNLIDTPGHVDFSSEVSRSLSGCQGVILLVDANQGVQAQTVSNFFMAFANDLIVVPVLNKIDLPNADPESVKIQLNHLFEIKPETVLCASAKAGIGIREIFEAIIERIPPPNRHGKLENGFTRFLLQDSWYDKYRGAVNLVQVFDGKLKKGDQIVSNKTGQVYTIRTLGIMAPEEMEITALYPGQVGVMTCNMRSTKEAIIGDTFFHKDKNSEPLLEVTKPRPMVYAGFYPLDPSEQDKLKSAIEKVSLNDYSVTVEPETSQALGFGYRLGFLGLLHLEVFSQRLEDEYSAEVLITTPSVPYKVQINKQGSKRLGDEVLVRNPASWPNVSDIETTFEPIVKGTIICPSEQMGDILGLIAEYRGYHPDIFHVDQHRIKLEMILPLSEIVTNFFDDLKSMTSGYGSFDYEDAGYQESSLVKVDVLLNEKPVSELAFIAHSAKAKGRSSEVVTKLRDSLPRQQFSIKIQASVGSKVLAREDLRAYRKDVTSKCYGGDIRRKMKLLSQQAEGKKKMRMIGKIEIEKDTFIKLLAKNPKK